MPGPGGGSRGGGGFRGGGGSFGGGSRGPRPGGFGGPRPGGFGGPRPGGMPMGGMHVGGWVHRPRSYGGNGCGCLGGAMSILMTPLILIIFIVFFIIASFSGGTDVVINNGYDEEVFQDYANEQYQAEFGQSSAYEDNILIVFLTDEDDYSYAYIAWVGDHIVMDINHMMGADGTELGYAMESCINSSNYKYSLDTDLAFVVDKLTYAVEKMELESSFSCEEEHIQTESHLTNHTDLDMNEDMVNDALDDFTKATGIPMVIVVEDMNDVFGVHKEMEFNLSGGFLLVIVAVVVIITVTVIRRKKNEDDFGTPQKDSRYHEFDDQY